MVSTRPTCSSLPPMAWWLGIESFLSFESFLSDWRKVPKYQPPFRLGVTPGHLIKPFPSSDHINVHQYGPQKWTDPILNLLNYRGYIIYIYMMLCGGLWYSVEGIIPDSISWYRSSSWSLAASWKLQKVSSSQLLSTTIPESTVKKNLLDLVSPCFYTSIIQAWLHFSRISRIFIQMW